MFARFKMKLSEFLDSSDVSNASNNKYIREQIHKSLDGYSFKASIDVSAIEENWFPQVDAKVFLSHSHRDQLKVYSLAEHLHNEYGLSCFIDSMVWGYADELLKQLNKRLISETADENEKNCIRNKNSSMVYILLQSALTKMIDNCECVIFVDTPNSINLASSQVYTNSIWLYNELLMASRIRTKTYESYRQCELSHSETSLYIPVEMDSFIDLTIEDFVFAKEKALFKDDPNNILDVLYLQKGLIKETK